MCLHQGYVLSKVYAGCAIPKERAVSQSPPLALRSPSSGFPRPVSPLSESLLVYLGHVYWWPKRVRARVSSLAKSIARTGRSTRWRQMPESPLSESLLADLVHVFWSSQVCERRSVRCAYLVLRIMYVFQCMFCLLGVPTCHVQFLLVVSNMFSPGLGTTGWC